jgi:hypothetical protein
MDCDSVEMTGIQGASSLSLGVESSIFGADSLAMVSKQLHNELDYSQLHLENDHVMQRQAVTVDPVDSLLSICAIEEKMVPELCGS